MRELHGVGVGSGIVIGSVLRMPEPLPEPSSAARDPGIDAQTELDVVTEALAATADDLAERGQRAGGDAQAVLDAQAMMAKDPALADDIAGRIRDGSTGERAVFDAFATFQTMLTDMGGYMAERAADLADVAQRVIAHLRGVPPPGVPESPTPFVLVARDLAPADTALLDLDKVLALVTQDGGPTSHTAILARALSIPAIVGVAGALELTDDTTVIVDPGSGTVVAQPSDSLLAAARERAAEIAARATAPITDGVLADGESIPLLANLGKPEDADEAVALGAEGVGLFRTEFLFLDAHEAPSVESQAEQYTRVLAAFPGRKVVVRCLDAGADKPLAFLTTDNEPNPALGQRGLRALREHERVLDDQLTALRSAQDVTDADLWVMAPMVSDADEAAWFVERAKSHGIRVAGIMAEVPSLALMAEEVMPVTDFVSIGTNDLTQYTLAADRQLASVARFQDPWHPAVLRLVKMLGDAGRASDTPVGVCGEAAADPLLAVVLVGLGVSTLSMAPSALADVRAELAQHTRTDAERAAAAAVSASSAAVARSAARETLA